MIRFLLLCLLAVPVLADPGFSLACPEFAEGKSIPKVYTCEGHDVSPPLRWSQPPAGTRELAVLCLDPDAQPKTFVHWLLAGIPPATRELKAGVPEFVPGHNDFGGSGYRGPCPPKGAPHHYRFEVVALDAPLHLKPDTTWASFEKAAEGHVLARARLTGVFSR